MSLKDYRRKRDFTRTREPRGKSARRSSGQQFVIQKHDASHLHYDFRLEFEGVLKSWAVPKGPSLDPAQKRLAIQVEDHPLEYGSFEGIIPEHEYGAGTVLLWDRGQWEPVGDPAEGFRSGKLKFILHGEKLQGGWMLVRRSRSTSNRPEWLLFKERDEFARPQDEFDVTAEEPSSVATGRTLAQIKADQDCVWGADCAQAGKPQGRRTESRRSSTSRSSSARASSIRAPRRHADPMPTQIEAQLATLVKEPPEGELWVHEIKFDGYRLICHIDKRAHARESRARPRAWCETRAHQDWTERFSSIAAAAEELPVRQAILDGEVVVLRPDGVTSFEALQQALHESRQQKLVYFAFDLLYLDGEDLRSRPLEDRKNRLVALGLLADRGPIRYSQHLVGSGREAFAEAERLGLEGIVCKRRDRPYTPGRGPDWLKVKCKQRAEFVIGGYTDPAGARSGFGALLVGYHRGGELVYAGRVGTGFDERTLAELLATFKPLERSTSPFDGFPERASQARGVHWVRPKLVAQLAFSNWTRDRLLRQPVFQGLREDKPAGEVMREVPAVEAVSNNVSSRRWAKGRHKAPASKAPAKTNHANNNRGNREEENQEEEIAGVRLTHPNKVLYPDVGLTKRDLAQYYVDQADWILPYLEGRPLSLVRCPDGVEGGRFFQKHPHAAALGELRRIRIREKQEEKAYLVVDNVQGLVSLVQAGTLEIHAWGSREDDLERPDRLIFDLDPAPDVPWPRVIAAAQEIRDFLHDLGLVSFVKATGGKGLHLVAPIQRRHAWNDIDEFCRLVARAIQRAAPDRFVANMSKQQRTGKIFLDYLRNQRGATAIAPYSTRARATAPVAVPLSWEELPKLRSSDQYRLPDVVKRLARLRADPWSELSQIRQTITAAMFHAVRG
jgi:bifunctional non-homologous end joining protein LigD